MKQVPLRNRAKEIVAYALVDDEDYDVLSLRKWHKDDNDYACTKILHPLGGKTKDGKRRSTSIRMHRLVCGLEWGDPRIPDHKDRNPLNNQKYNLEVGTRALNHQNRNLIKGKTSQYRGVSWSKANGKWQAVCKLNYKRYFLGLYDIEEKANEVVVAWRREHMPFSEDARVD